MADDQEYRGAMGSMTAEHITEFLAGAPLARLACLKPDGSPYVMPVWCQWDGESIWLVGRQRSVWGEDIKNDPRISVVIDGNTFEGDSDEGSLIPKVYFEGVAEIVEEPNVGGAWVKVAEDMSYRYLGPDGPTYLTSTLNQPRWLIKMTPSATKTWHGVGWARRYWVEDTGGPSYDEAHST